jgi:hypothetical protein
MRNAASGRIRRVTAAVVAASALAIVVGAQFDGDSGEGAAQASGASKATYRVLARPANARDEGFARSSAALRKVAERSPEIGLEPRGARVVRSDDARTLAVVPAQAAPCLVSEGPSAPASVSCGTGTEPKTAMVNYGSAVGVVPDTVQTVSFTMTDGSVVTGEVSDNMWNAPAEAASVSFAVDGRARTIELMPLSAQPEGTTVGPDGITTIRTPDPVSGR